MSNKFKIIFSLIAVFFLFIFSFYSKDFRIDASSDTLVAQTDKDFLYFNYYNKIFPSKNYLILAIKSNHIIDDKLINHINDLSDKIIKLKGVDNIFNINKAPILFLNNSSLTDLSSQNIETINNSNFELNEVLEEFSINPIYKNQIININKNITSIIIYLTKNASLEEKKKNLNNSNYKNQYFEMKNKIDLERKHLIKNIRNIISENKKDYEYFLGGIDMITDDVISFVKNDILIFSISALLIIIFVLFAIFREIKWVLISLFTSLYAVLSMFGLLGLIKIEITAISSNFSSLMFILSISMNIHIINYYRQSETPNILNTIKTMIWPCLYTVLTTIVAFISLTISDIKPVIDFGFIMILSLVVILVISFTILPLLISFFPNINQSKRINLKIISIFNKYSIRNSNTVIISSVLFFAVSIYGITKLDVENSFINYFNKKTEIYQGMKLIDTELGGTTPMDIILTFNENEEDKSLLVENEKLEEDTSDDDILFDNLFDNELESNTWFTNEKLNTIKDIQNYLESKKEIGKIQSINNLIETANLINKEDLSIFELAVLYDKIPEDFKKDLIYPYLSTNENMIKISARIKDSEKIKRKELLNDINNYLESNHKENLKEFKVNGLLVLYNNMLQSLFSSQIKSIGFVITAIFIMLLILFKSWKLSLIGIIPNIFASSYILGLIGILKIPLDIMTITIAAISIGIAVDNTIHYLYRYIKNYTNDKSMENAIKLTHNTVGIAVLTTSVTIAFGFSVLCLSNFIPTVFFGVFTALAMIFAMIGVLVVLPSIIYKIK
ncbi:MAG: hypothetical protein CFH15_01539 [Alphaproteobacteria bacterium MarineAlpha5_Bin5]|nr:MAG: hypothetical protein CFH15_01539 [Alphaproteobacteria bacterium MarineAlpha5_Bin5]